MDKDFDQKAAEKTIIIPRNGDNTEQAVTSDGEGIKDVKASTAAIAFFKEKLTKLIKCFETFPPE